MADTTSSGASSSGLGSRVCIVGAGAIGGWIAAKLALAGEDVSVLARGAVLEKIRNDGIELHSGGERHVARVRASSDANELGPQDIVIVAVKAQSLPPLAASLRPLIHPGTAFLPAINGLPWWFLLPPGAPQSGRRLVTVDPDGEVDRVLQLGNVVGMSVFASSSSPAPGVVRHGAGARIVLGEPTSVAGDAISARVAELAARFTRAGFDGQASADIRGDIWNKILGNGCFNPVSMLTLSPTDNMIDDPGLHRLFVRMMKEALTVGAALGLKLDVDPVARIAQTRKLGHIKTSMLQDLEAGRPVELEGILGALVECAEISGVNAPTLDGVLAMARGRARALAASTGA